MVHPVRTAWIVVLGALVSAPGGGAAQSFERVARIGEVMGDPEYTFGFVAGGAFGPGGEVYVLDASNAVVREYDALGQHVRNFGRPGSGPGEFRRPVRLGVAMGELWLTDGELRRTVRFALDGSHLETSRYPEAAKTFDAVFPLRHGIAIAANEARISSAGLDLLAASSGTEAARHGAAFRRATAYRVVALTDGKRPDTLASFDHGTVMWAAKTERGTANGPVDKPWGEGGSFAVGGDSLVALIDAYYGSIRIMAATPAGLVELKRRQLRVEPRPLTEADWRGAEARIRQERPIPANSVLTGPPFAAHLGSAVFDDTGALWIRHITEEAGSRDRSAGRRYIVIPADDRPQRVVELPAGLGILAVKGDLVLAVGAGEYSTHFVEVLRMLDEHQHDGIDSDDVVVPRR